jgi:hypothetical protein
LLDTFPIKKGLKKGCSIAISFHLFFRMDHYKNSRKQEGLKLSGTQLLLYADDVNLLRES